MRPALCNLNAPRRRLLAHGAIRITCSYQVANGDHSTSATIILTYIIMVSFYTYTYARTPCTNIRLSRRRQCTLPCRVLRRRDGRHSGTADVSFILRKNHDTQLVPLHFFLLRQSALRPHTLIAFLRLFTYYQKKELILKKGGLSKLWCE